MRLPDQACTVGACQTLWSVVTWSMLVQHVSMHAQAHQVTWPGVRKLRTTRSSRMLPSPYSATFVVPCMLAAGGQGFHGHPSSNAA